MSILNRLRKNEAKTAATEAKKSSSKKAVSSEKAEKKAESTVKHSVATIVATGVIMRPVVTEKSTLTGTYTFEIAPSSNKSEVMKAVEAVYGVRPASVRIINVMGKAVRSKKGYGFRKDWKKAIVRLPAGKTINVYEGI